MKNRSRLIALLLVLVMSLGSVAFATEGGVSVENLDAETYEVMLSGAQELATAADAVLGWGMAKGDGVQLCSNHYLPGDYIIVQSEVLATLSNGALVKVFEGKYNGSFGGYVSGEWYKVDYYGTVGYIQSDYLAFCSCDVAEGVGLEGHSDSACPDKMYYMSVCALTAEEIYAGWESYTAEGQAFVLHQLEATDSAKQIALRALIYQGNVPACDCGNADKPLYEHSDGCARKAYFKALAEVLTAEEIYADWNYYPADGREYILAYLNELSGDSRYAEKLDALLGLIGGVVDQEIEGMLPGGYGIQLSGAMPENAVLETGSVGESARNYVLENLLHSKPEDLGNWKTYAFDLKIKSNGVLWQPTEDGVEVTIGGIGEGAEKMEIIHLLDSQEAIEAERAAGRLLSHYSTAIPAGFEAETAASGDANLIYYTFVSPSQVRINEDGSVTFRADSFSKYIFSATVGDKTYNYEIGNGEYMLGSILMALNTGKTVDEVECTVSADGKEYTPDIKTEPESAFTISCLVETLDDPENPESISKIYALRDYRLQRTEAGKVSVVTMTITFIDSTSITMTITKSEDEYSTWPTAAETDRVEYDAELSAANGVSTFVITGDEDGNVTYEKTTVSSNVIWVLKDDVKVTMLGSVDVAGGATLTIKGNGRICNAIGTEAANYGVMFDLAAGSTMEVTGEESRVVFDGQSGIELKAADDNKDVAGKYSGVAIRMQSANLKMTNADITNMYNTYSSSVGTGIHCINNDAEPNRLKLSNVKVSNCLNRTGHSILLINGIVDMDNCSFVNNCNNSSYAGIIKGSGKQFCQLTMRNCTASGNYSEGWGGVILWAAGTNTSASDISDQTSWAKIEGCSFSNNRARYLGGAISNEGVMTISGSSITNNKAAAGGGIAVFPFTLNEQGSNTEQNLCGLTLESSNTISGNEATADADFYPDFVVSGDNDGVSYPVGGGGIWFYMNRAEYNATLRIGSGNTISNNKAAFGGGIYVHRTAGASATLVIDGATIKENTATKYGGGIALVDAELAVEDGKVDNNNADDGGGVYIKKDKLNKAEVTVSGDGSISSNVAENNGGGVYVTNGAEMTVNGGLIVGNKAGVNAGSASSEGANDRFDGNTVSGDSGKRVGGGVYVGNNSKFTMEGDYIGIFKNKAEVAADDVYASGEETYVILPAISEMWLAGQYVAAEEPTGWYEDYMLGDTSYEEALTDEEEASTGNTGRYRYAEYSHAVTDKDKSIDTQKFACITLGLTKLGTGSLTINKHVVDKAGNDIDPDQVFVFKMEKIDGGGYTFFTSITGSGTVNISGVPAGRYTVTELVDWSGRYKNTAPGVEKNYEQTVVIQESAREVECNFTNCLDNDQWLDDNTNVETNTCATASEGEGDGQ